MFLTIKAISINFRLSVTVIFTGEILCECLLSVMLTGEGMTLSLRELGDVSDD